MSFLTIATGMATRGVHVVPTYPGLRHPALRDWQDLATRDPETINKWGSNGYAEYNCCSVAKKEGVGVLDIDDLEAAQRRGMPELPYTLTVKTPGGGRHIYFTHSAVSRTLGNCSVKEGEKKIVEVKCHNAAVCAPGCTRDDGGVYEIVLDAPIDPLPWEMVEWLERNTTSKRAVSGNGRARKLHPDFDREALFEHYGWEFATEFSKDGADYYVFDSCPFKGAPHADQVRSKKTCLIIGNCVGFDCKVCGEELGWRDLVQHMKEQGLDEFPHHIFAEDDDELLFDGIDVEDSPAETAILTPDQVQALLSADSKSSIDTEGFAYRQTDTGNSERLVRRFGSNIRHVADQGVWRVWSGKQWVVDRGRLLSRLSKKVAQELFEEAAAIEDSDERKKMIAWAMRSETKDRRTAMVDLGATEKDIVTRIEDYDEDPWLFNLQNGTVDLQTQVLRSHSRGDMLSKISPVAYDPEAACPAWESFLNEIMDGDREMIDFLARAAGYSISGDIGIQAMFFLHGDGANGKSVFIEVLRYILGDYAKNASFDTFVVQKNDGRIRNDLAALVGARLVTASESQDGHRLDEAIIKTLTGGDPITTRFLHKEYFTFYPQFKLWMSSNYKPAIRGTDSGIWRRVNMIPFEVTIPEEKRDPQLATKLKAEAPGILNWMLCGLKVYHEQGMMYPAKVREATSQYRESQDVIAQFIAAKCALSPYAETRFNDLYQAYKLWADNAREYKMPERKFSEALKKRRELTTKRKKGLTWYAGIQLQNPEKQSEVDPNDAGS
jgi:putative DNA primase/helicase